MVPALVLVNGSSTIVFLSTGTYLNALPAFKNLDRDILIGSSFKYYSLSGTGSNNVGSLADSAGSGYSADLGRRSGHRFTDFRS